MSTLIQKNQHGVIFILGVVLIDSISFGIILPVMPHLIIAVSNASLSDAARLGGYLTLAYAFMQFFSAPILGNLSDKYGRRPILLYSLMALGLSNILMAIASTILWLFIARIIAGATSSTLAVAYAYITDITSIETRAKRFGMVGAACGIGLIIGPTFGGVFGSFGERTPFITAAVLGTLNFIYGYLFLGETLSQKYRRPFDLRRSNPISAMMLLRSYPMVLGLAAANFLFMIGQISLISFWAFFLIEKFNWSVGQIGLSLALSGISAVLIQGVILGRVTYILGSRKTTILGLVVSVLSYSAYAFAESGWQIYLLVIIAAFAGFVGPSLQAMMTSKIPAEIQGEFQGTLSSLNSIALILGPLIMTQIFSSFTGANMYFYFPGAPFIATAVVTGISLFVFLLILRRY